MVRYLRWRVVGFLPIVFVEALSSPAVAGPKHGGGSAIVGARGLGFSNSAGDTPDAIGSAGLDLRGAVALGSFPVGFAAGAGYHFGASVPSGFAYEAGLMPIGLAVMVDKVGWLAVMAGGDLSGVTARVPFAPRWIAEARLELQLPGPLHFAAFIRPAWLGVDARQDGADAIDFADELDAGAGLRIGSERVKWGMDSSRGLFVGGVMRQWLGATGYGAVLGYTVDVQFGG